MRTAVTVWFAIFASILAGCSMKRQEIREITLSSGGEVTYTTGHGSTYSVTFRRDGTAESRNVTTENFVAQAPVVKRARFSTDRFERLAGTINSNGFFEKKEEEGHVDDTWQNLKVVSTTGEKTIQTLGRSGDPQIKAMVDAVSNLAGELQWDNGN